MKPHEILQKIIDEDGNCHWVMGRDDVCTACPMGGLKSCPDVVNKIMGGWDDADYMEVAKRMLTDLEVNRVILGEDIEE